MTTHTNMPTHIFIDRHLHALSSKLFGVMGVLIVYE